MYDEVQSMWKTKMHPWKLYRSRTPGKKWDVYVPTKHGKPVRVSYGAAGMSDFTKHRDVDRRERYRRRHRHDHIGDPYKAGFWSWWHLWGTTSNARVAFADAVARAKRAIGA